jgi:hypothetical protein
MDWVLYLVLILFGVLLASIKDVGKETIGRVFKMIGHLIYRKFIEAGLSEGDFPIDVGIFTESTKEPIDSKQSIRILSFYGRPIEKCRVLLNKKELQWGNKNGRYEIHIEAGGSGNVRIPIGAFTKNTRVQVWDGKKILINKKFEDLSLL